MYLCVCVSVLPHDVQPPAEGIRSMELELQVVSTHLMGATNQMFSLQEEEALNCCAIFPASRLSTFDDHIEIKYGRIEFRK